MITPSQAWKTDRSCYVHLKGGLGNQLFQIAAGYAHCRRHGLRLELSRESQGRLAKWTGPTAQCAKYVVDRPTDERYPYEEPTFGFRPIPPQASTLSGFFQSSRYFEDCADEIRALFACSHGELDAQGIVVHVRRGDYTALLSIHGFLTDDYYARAVALALSLVPDGHLVIFSDDLEYCRGMTCFTENPHTFVEESDTSLALGRMSQGRNFILSNSSFSWWAAWLASGSIVVVPDRWLGPGGPQDFEDIYEPSWLRIPC